MNAFEATSRNDCLDTAVRIAERAVDRALWHGDRCTWSANLNCESGARTSEKEMMGGSIYNGSSGVALFLSALAKVTGETRFLETADGAFRHAETEIGLQSNRRFGLYSGAPGVAWAMAQHASEWRKSEFADAALRVVEIFEDATPANHETDLLSGAAGALIALLDMGARLARPSLTASAVRFGEFLLEAALRRSNGWSWDTGMPDVEDDLVCFSHGSAGIGHVLLELASVSGDPRFAVAFIRGVAYDREHFNPTTGNWSDLRRPEVWELLPTTGDPTAASQDIPRRRVPRYEPRFYNTWCHGAVGIGLGRLRAFQLLGMEELASEARAAAAAVQRDVEDRGRIFGLCHGNAGSCDFLLEAARSFNSEDLRATVEVCAASARSDFLASGRLERGWDAKAWDPSLLVGEAGVGHFFLRLASAQTPSVLLPTAGQEGHPLDHREISALARDGLLDDWFPETLSVLGEAGIGDLRARIAPCPGAHEFRSVATTLLSLGRQIQSSALRRAAELACRTDTAKCELLGTRTMVATDFLRKYLPRTSASVTWETARFRLSPRVRLVESPVDDAAAQDELAAPRLLYFRGRAVEIISPFPLAAAVLSILVSDRCFEEIVAGLMGEPSADTDPTALRRAVREQLASALDAGIIEMTD